MLFRSCTLVEKAMEEGFFKEGDSWSLLKCLFAGVGGSDCFLLVGNAIEEGVFKEGESWSLFDCFFAAVGGRDFFLFELFGVN